ncbi:MAG: PHP domain-containing protein [Planctomycetota bacterium]|nr:MAG: PHP domain-containing protein [Planctomycetota bacterium]
MTGPRVDLHVHSDASDGLLAPDELARRMRAAGCEVIALTDHDTTAGLASFAAAAPHAIAAIELTCRVRPGPRGTVHLLGYGVDPEQPELVEVAAANRAAKRAQVRAILQRLAREEGIEISWEDLALGGAARGEDAYVGRHHVAAVLVRRGHARTRLKAFRRFLSAERVPCAEVVPASEALAALQAAGGLAVLAHPTHDDLT